MKLEYKVSLEDIITFNRNHLAASPTMQRNLLIVRLVWALTPLVAVSAIMYFENATPEKMMSVISAIALLFTAPVFLFYPVYHRWCCARQIRKIYSEGENRGLLGDHEMRIEGDSFFEKTEGSESKVSLASIEKVITADEHAYIYVGAAQAHVIPRNGVVAGDFDQFIEAIKKGAGKL